ncbi:MAG: iron-sulfur cluster repair di-iron protein [Saprospiraceae bacterium]|nr:iron-sulfur cluster repair di-iron protein [Saprospiraceae bacterium]
MESDLLTVEPTVAQFVAANHHAANVFKKYGIDFCCKGRKPLAQACAEIGVNTDTVRTELETLPSEDLLPSQDFHAWDTGFLAEYIVQTHHRYLLSELPLLREYTAKIARVHGERHPELRELFVAFAALQEELEEHLKKEEHILFPYIVRLSEAARHGDPVIAPPFGTAQNPIRMMEHEHDSAGDLLRRMRTLTHDYALPADACNSYRVTFAKLQQLERDLHQHIFLENNVLFPKAIELEASVVAAR